MNARVKGALLWGVVGLLTFLVLLQGYEIVQDISVELPVKIGATLIVGVASTVITYVASGRIDGAPAADDAATGDRNESLTSTDLDDADDTMDSDDGSAVATADENETS